MAHKHAKRIETDTVTLPDYWCSALINGDFSGIESRDEIARIEAAQQRLNDQGWQIVDCEEEARFTWHYRLYDPLANCDGGNVLDYTILRSIERLSA